MRMAALSRSAVASAARDCAACGFGFEARVKGGAVGMLEESGGREAERGAWADGTRSLTMMSFM